MDLTSYIASVSMNMSQASLAESASMKMLKNTMESTEAASQQMLEMLPAVGADQIGGLLDVTV